MLVVIGDKSGQLANRIFAFSHFIANALDNNYPLFNPAFAEYSDYFTATSANNFGAYRVRVASKPLSRLLLPSLSLLRKLKQRSKLHYCYCVGSGDEVNLATDIDFGSYNEYKYLVCYGWGFKDYGNLEKYADIIRSFFVPVQLYIDRIDDHLAIHMHKESALVAVHIRRGDYRHWRGGEYFFEDSVYADKMYQISCLYAEMGKRVQFLLCSNDKLSNQKFENFDCFHGTGHELEDLYLMSKCDLIIGPPSTYSMWASYYGETPLCYLVQPSARISMADFKVVCS